MLAMAVVNHQGHPSGGGSTGSGVEEEDDLLTRLRKLHQTLQECHWRVGLMDQRVEALQPNLHHRNSEDSKTSRQKQLDKNPIKTDTKQETCKLVNGIYDNEEPGDLIDTDDEELSLPVSGRMDNKIRPLMQRRNLVLPVEQINVFETVNGREDILHLAEKHAKDLYDMFQSKSSPVENEGQCLTMTLSEENELTLDEDKEIENVLSIIEEEEEQITDYLWEHEVSLVDVYSSNENRNTVDIETQATTVGNQVPVDAILRTIGKREDEVNKSNEDLNETFKEIQCNNSKGYEDMHVNTERVNGNDMLLMGIIEKVTKDKEMSEEKLINDSDQYINQSYSTENMIMYKEEIAVLNNLFEKERYDKTLLTFEEKSLLNKLRENGYPDTIVLSSEEISLVSSLVETEHKHWLLNDPTREKRPHLMRSENIDLEEYDLGDITKCYVEGINKQCESFCISKSDNVKGLDERVGGNDRSSESVTREVLQKTFPECGEKYPYNGEKSSGTMNIPVYISRDNEGLSEIHQTETPHLTAPEVTVELNLVRKSSEHLKPLLINNRSKQCPKNGVIPQNFRKMDNECLQSKSKIDKKDCKSKENSRLENLQDITNHKLSNESHRKLKPIKFKTKKRKNIVHKLGLNRGAKQIIIVKDKDALIDNGVNTGRWSLASMFTLFLLLLMLLLLCYLLLTVPIVTISVKHNGGAVAF